MTIKTYYPRHKPKAYKQHTALELSVRDAWIDANGLKYVPHRTVCLERLKTGKCKSKQYECRHCTNNWFAYSEMHLDHAELFKYEKQWACYVCFNYDDYTKPSPQTQDLYELAKQAGLFVIRHPCWSVNNWYGTGTIMIEVWRPDVLRAIIEKRQAKGAEFFDQTLHRQAGDLL